MIRRQLNQTVFAMFRVYDQGDVRADLTEPFAGLLADIEPANISDEDRDNIAERSEGGEHPSLISKVLEVSALGAESKNRVPLRERGSNLTYLVAGDRI